MNTYSDVATFNLKVVVSETGLKPDTIRAWERRYGLPDPERTAGGHRLYSERDIGTLKWLVSRKKEGMTISKAVKLWHQIQTEGLDPLQEMPPNRQQASATPTVVAPGRSLEEARRAWIHACLGFQEAEAERILAEAFAEFSVETVCVSILQQALSEIGNLWYEDQISVQQEHFASELATRRIEALIAAAPQPRRSETLMVSCATDEDHTFPTLLLVLLLRRRGYRAVFLGADVPLEELEETIDAIKPDLVVLAAQHIRSAASLQEMGFFLERAGVPMGYGGQIFNRVPELRTRIPGEFLGEQLMQAVGHLERLLEEPPQVPRVPDRDPDLMAALEDFQDSQPRIEGQVWDQLKEFGIPHASLETANHFLGQGVAAALTLGDLAFMGNDLEWINGLLQNYGSNHGFLQRYLHAYRDAAQDQLNARGAPIIDWLAQTIGGD